MAHCGLCYLNKLYIKKLIETKRQEKEKMEFDNLLKENAPAMHHHLMKAQELLKNNTDLPIIHWKRENDALLARVSPKIKSEYTTV